MKNEKEKRCDMCRSVLEEVEKKQYCINCGFITPEEDYEEELIRRFG